MEYLLKINDYLPSYNLFVGIGIALSMLFLQNNELFKQKSDEDKHKIHISIITSLILGFIGAFIFDAYSKNIDLNFNNLNQIGLTFLGGLLSGLFVLILSLRIFSLQIIDTLNILTSSFCIAHFFGRIGCFVAGCCFGSPTNSIFGVIYPTNTIPHNHYHDFVKIHPTQIYESLFILCVFIFLIKIKPKNQFFIYIILYSIFRFIVEYFREDERGIIFNQEILTPSQTISLFLIIFTIIILFLINKLKIYSK